MDPALVRICFGNLTNHFIKIDIANVFENNYCQSVLKMIIANLSENDYCQSICKWLLPIYSKINHCTSVLKIITSTYFFFGGGEGNLYINYIIRIFWVLLWSIVHPVSFLCLSFCLFFIFLSILYLSAVLKVEYCLNLW